ncbi:helix-turn-helix transcriptional regulator [Streptomyces somaliensis DSM 40738]|uniref:Helix-turn-helix transcriptional regulator n=1 Tax=Streptomyces somaliensis (strain ATCC 33201 / DSM 40738 / JCM 12659 / KCTC 9044 / NCTC 11332 / NRRL B-12077 / IP 733) TaxID=1134445 RepID=A0AA44ID22_STRE0|nr:helix-turn-helix transcriptional regulator [Streptomyces somaliensis]MCQ0022868.1 helix-turn-helix transcriptional regulator [Streptomyces somaliensis DSM 40738]NKY14032.1 helix-turn-helix transcriptional regulator [Streptomyces somaliensis DSM 40738]
MTATVTDGTDPAATPLAASLRRLRRQSGWSQARLAAELGYHHSVVSRWEAGARKPSLAVVRRIDHVLDTGGELARDWAGADGGRSRTPPREEPLPGLPGPSRGGEGPQVVPDHAPWPVRLPHHGVDCPLHPSAHCAVPPAERAAEIHRAFVSDPVRHTAPDAVHVLAGHLAVRLHTATEQGFPRGDAVEAVLRPIVRALASAEGPYRTALHRLAASYASLAGQLRMLRGQHGAAMALFTRGLRWAADGEDVGQRAALLSDMNLLARMEHDGASAVEYAEALLATARDRVWVRALGHLNLARGHAALGDLGETTRNVARARALLDERGPDDGDGPEWISGERGRALVEAGIGGALRDIAVCAADRGLARAALSATEYSIRLVPAGQRPSAVLLSLRRADCHACAGQPDDALAITSSVLAEAMATPLTTVCHELRGLRSRIAARWPHPVHPPAV